MWNRSIIRFITATGDHVQKPIKWLSVVGPSCWCRQEEMWICGATSTWILSTYIPNKLIFCRTTNACLYSAWAQLCPLCSHIADCSRPMHACVFTSFIASSFLSSVRLSSASYAFRYWTCSVFISSPHCLVVLWPTSKNTVNEFSTWVPVCCILLVLHSLVCPNFQ